MSDLPTLPAHILLQRLREGSLTSARLVEAVYDRIARLNPVHNAIVSLRPLAEVVEEARQADAAPSAGPLHGLPFAIKDLSQTKGLRTTMGSPLFAEDIPTSDALHVARIRKAGAIIIGKTNTPEFGLGSHTYNTVFGATGNAFDSTRSAGGSSGGAAVAVALGLVPMADGSDFGGSLRNPAGWNNIFGYRPSQGLVPAVPSADPFFGQLATDGPMARNIRDLHLLLTVQAGYDPRAPLSLPDQDLSITPRDFAQCRVGWLGDLGGHLPFEDGILATCENALATSRMEAVTPDTDFEELWQAFVTLRHFNLSARLSPLHADLAKRALLKPEARWEVEGFLALTANDILQASMTRAKWYARILSLFDRFDILALPSAQVHPFAIGHDWPKSIAGRRMDSYHRWMEVVAPATLSGCPVLNVPAGFVDGMPVGLQLIGRPRGDRELLGFGLGYEARLTAPTGIF
ncbi:amidase [Falsirhodobacter halotolerans]|uniref:amidase n=1 Tax=Falsirhodobacter halotolerans TaxID=1146892 RepID=UPI001FD412B5|nr:amidase [Falsirhodobacter halotolerans]MCJ8139119.1 amidase [Falsirhodobacter halotolerans]